MKVHEYQAKALMAEYGIPIPNGGVVSNINESLQVAQNLRSRVVVKAQVHAGGRGSAGGVKLVDTPDQAVQVVKSLLGADLVTSQTGPGGVPVRAVLLEEAVDIEQELYLAVAIDGAVGGPVVIASEMGGIDIETVAATAPGKILRVEPDPVLGLQPFMARQICYQMKLPTKLVRPASDLIMNLYRLFIEMDCSLAEINPLGITEDGRVMALDAKINFDDDALFRQGDVMRLRDMGQEDPLEAEAAGYGISFIRLDGDVGCLVNGAGLAMATMDVISGVGARPANFLDVGGGADEEKVKRAFLLILADSRVKRVLVNIFGGILRCDVAARGIIMACEEAGMDLPIVVRMLGTNLDEGLGILRESGLNITLVETLREAAMWLA